ncbi:hypothetical protein ES703_113947 [subsurface metagenome]
MFLLEKLIFSKEYRRMVADLKKIQRQELKEEEKLYDIRTSEGKGRKGSADMSGSLPKSRQSGRNTTKESGSINREEEKNSDSGATTADVSKI